MIYSGAMAMRVMIKEVALKMGIDNAKQLAKVTGLSVTSCYQLWNGTAKAISFESLNTLCNVLKAGPAILLDYTPDVQPGGPREPQQEKAKPTARASPSRSSRRSPKGASPTIAIAG